MIENTNLNNDMKSAHARKFMISPPASLDNIIEAEGKENVLQDMGIEKIQIINHIPLDKMGSSQTIKQDGDGICGLNYYADSPTWCCIYKIDKDGNSIIKTLADNAKIQYALDIEPYNGGYVVTYTGANILRGYYKPLGILILNSDLNVIEDKPFSVTAEFPSVQYKTSPYVSILGDKAYVFSPTVAGVIDLKKDDNYYSEIPISYPDATAFSAAPYNVITFNNKIYFSTVASTGDYANKMLTFDGTEFKADISMDSGVRAGISNGRFQIKNNELRIHVIATSGVSFDTEFVLRSDNTITADINIDQIHGYSFTYPMIENGTYIINANVNARYQYPFTESYQEIAEGITVPRGGFIVAKFEPGATKTKLVGFGHNEYYVEV